MLSSKSGVPRFRTVDLAYIALFAVLIAACAWISIPMTIPFTLQTFGIFAALTILGGRRGTYAVLVYLLLGAVGLPVFAGFQGGLSALLGTTGGYLVGFLLSALLFWLLSAKLGNTLPMTILTCLLSLGVCYTFGTIWFLIVYARTAGPVGLAAALGWCVIPFLVPDLVKLVLAVMLAGRARRYLK